MKKLGLAIGISFLAVTAWNMYLAPTLFGKMQDNKNNNQMDVAKENRSVAGSVDGLDGIDLAFKDRDEIISSCTGCRVHFDTGKMYGTINLRGLKIDDLSFRGYHDLAKDAEGFPFLSPNGSKDAFFVAFEWSSEEGIKVPDSNSMWKFSKDSAKELVPGSSVSLFWTNGQGQDFVIDLEVDDSNMIKTDLHVRNYSAHKILITPKIVFKKLMETTQLKYSTKHDGLLGVFKGVLSENGYSSLAKSGSIKKESGSIEDVASSGGKRASKLDWFGLSDKYWFMSSFSPEGASFFTSASHMSQGSQNLFIVSSHFQKMPIKPLDYKNHFKWNIVVGPKNIDMLRSYQERSNLKMFDRIIDFGIFHFISKRALLVLRFINSFVNSYGLSIIVLTFIFRVLIMPLSYYSAVSMSKMVKLRPKMDALKAKYPDKVEYNKAIMRLYSEEDVSPFSGFLPILLQMPMFLALYKILSVSIELRMSEFLYIKDLSAPDSFSNLLNFFGANVSLPGAIDLGVLPLLIGLTTYAQQMVSKSQNQTMAGMNPKHFAIGMSLLLMMVFANMPSGLLIYWVSTNVFTILQQMVFNKVLD